jgi:hypothetical protein
MPASSREPPGPEPDERGPEHYGPLIVRRMVKDDGRALIRFDRAGGEAPKPGGGERA